MSTNKVIPHSLLSDFDIDLFKSGKHFRLYEKMGSHLVTLDGVEGTYFAVFAPAAKSVAVMGEFDFWQGNDYQLNVRWDSSGIWEGFIPNIGKGTLYKYKIHSNHNGQILEKADPFARRCELRPNTASIIWEDDYKWADKKWMSKRKDVNALNQPYSVYEVHLASWRRNVMEDRSLTYREMADELVSYVKESGFTHVEFMPIMEHPYDPSWGYQLTGYFAPTARFGNPEDFKFLVDKFHQNGIGVILDWVPSHFPEDAHGLGNFDGSNVYEHPDPRRGYHQDWKSLIFNYGRNEVKSFLISNALFWLDLYHADGLRVDAVASMLYLDYSREDGEWEPNMYGGNENLEAIAFLKEFNEAVYGNYPDVQTIAEESTSFSGVTRPVYTGGLGFGMKWMMGWMHDTLEYYKKEPIYRRHHQNEVTFSLVYAFSENFMLPLSHDEVVYGKGSIIDRMPGDEWQRFANLRTLYTSMFTHPGTKLLFMGGEFGQTTEWDFEGSLPWHLLQFDPHKGMHEFIKDLNKLYRTEKALFEHSFSGEGFEWIDLSDSDNSVITFLRKGKDSKNDLLVACSFTPVVRTNYRIGVPESKGWKEIFNSDNTKYWGSGVSNSKVLKTEAVAWNGREHSIQATLPPLGVAVFKKK
ncbi:1,4-alpha-glucan branching protein GlgB [Saprospiraceae bacterium]|jgi:1,4-alpha-glucan branching enzyme|nr:1,4-alpha-glucan branching protein GlgB [Bacteroidota bacterium]MDB4727393.1 1,4-alpha-glucan branching protein GlgB [Saprospiraceae bacterium]MDF1867969.1 1,4-alpha-glucan branching protein GlgB [Saprospiraceae bacterium]